MYLKEHNDSKENIILLESLMKKYQKFSFQKIRKANSFHILTSFRKVFRGKFRIRQRRWKYFKEAQEEPENEKVLCKENLSTVGTKAFNSCFIQVRCDEI